MAIKICDDIIENMNARNYTKGSREIEKIRESIEHLNIREEDKDKSFDDWGKDIKSVRAIESKNEVSKVEKNPHREDIKNEER